MFVLTSKNLLFLVVYRASSCEYHEDSEMRVLKLRSNLAAANTSGPGADSP